MYNTYSFDSLVIGTGCAGYNAADLLHSYGVTDIAVITENVTSGTSRNTGSDKQTYYKLTLCGDTPDSVESMAGEYFNGRAMDGEHALAEAALSAKCFYRLVELGVPFPHNGYGEYVGYKTDHDSKCRATSVGPYTSRKMTECLENAVKARNIQIFNHRQAVKLLVDHGGINGVVVYNTDKNAFEVFLSQNIVLATGGPAGMFLDSAFPVSQFGASGLAFEAGVMGRNLTEWQCGLASVNPRWNVSGTYMQVLPRFISTDQKGENPREFLCEYFSNAKEMLSKIFLKGYQWPFDVRKVMDGSSIIDILVYQETQIRGRKVYLDFMHNCGDAPFDKNLLSSEALAYLENADVCFGTPIQRLRKMNEPAYQLYLEKGVDIGKELLEIKLCVQHNNGGLAVDLNWQTNIEGLFAVGEVAGTHGVYRPGGSALNSGQVGSAMAAQFISKNLRKGKGVVDDQINIFISTAERAIDSANANLAKEWIYLRKKMSRVGSAIRNRNDIAQFLSELEPYVKDYFSKVRISGMDEMDKYLRLRSIVVSQYVYLNAMMDYMDNGKGSRGSALYTDGTGQKAGEGLPELFRFSLEDPDSDNMIQEILFKDGKCSAFWRKAHEIPRRDLFFENVWKKYRAYIGK